MFHLIPSIFKKFKQWNIIPFHLKPLIQTEPWSWPSGWLGILEFAPPKVSGSFRSSANFGGLSPYRVCSGFK